MIEELKAFRGELAIGLLALAAMIALFVWLVSSISADAAFDPFRGI